MGSILVIEDEKGILGLIETALRRFGHRVETALDGAEGIRKFDEDRFDVVITDYLMPEVDGAAVLQHIRRSPRRFVPIIGMSGTPWLLAESGFDRVLAKPFPLTELVDAVRRLLETAAACRRPRRDLSPAFQAQP